MQISAILLKNSAGTQILFTHMFVASASNGVGDFGRSDSQGVGAIFPTEVNNSLGQLFIITSNEGTLIGGDWIIIICCSYGQCYTSIFG
jgi:hypothetical protein